MNATWNLILVIYGIVTIGVLERNSSKCLNVIEHSIFFRMWNFPNVVNRFRFNSYAIFISDIFQRYIYSSSVCMNSILVHSDYTRQSTVKQKIDLNVKESVLSWVGYDTITIWMVFGRLSSVCCCCCDCKGFFMGLYALYSFKNTTFIQNSHA